MNKIPDSGGYVDATPYERLRIVLTPECTDYIDIQVLPDGIRVRTSGGMISILPEVSNVIRIRRVNPK